MNEPNCDIERVDEMEEILVDFFKKVNGLLPEDEQFSDYRLGETARDLCGIFNLERVEKHRKALELIKNKYPLPTENTDLIHIEVLYEIQLIVNDALEG